MSGRGYIGLTLWLDEDSDELIILDQTRLPNEESSVAISTARALYDAIRRLQVRGAPAIGVAAALGLYACAVRFEDETPEGFLYSLRKTKAFIASARPTAQNLFWALERTERAAGTGSIPEMLARIRSEALAIFEEDIAICRAIGENGLSLLKDGDTLLTHCNAGALAAVRYGTALAPVYVGLERGMRFRIYADETRPLLQGARIVGCDRVARNYDFANKTGTLSLAVNAKYFGVPFYVAAPSPTFDDCCATGADIVIEQRPGGEVTEQFFSSRKAPEGIGVYNPAFDVIPHTLVSAFITEKGVIRLG